MSQRGGGGRRRPADSPSPAPSRGRGRGGRRGRGRSSGSGESLAQPSPSSSQEVTRSAIQPPESAASVSSLSREVEKKLTLAAPASSKAVRPPARPGFGTFGKKIVVRANHFLVEVADKELHHYDVSIAPEVTSKRINRSLISELVTLFGKASLGGRLPAYDGRKSLYTAGPLPFELKEFVVKLTDKDASASGSSSSSLKKERQFKVTIKLASRPDIHHLRQFLSRRQLDAPQETIQAFDVILRMISSEKCVAVGRSIFPDDMIEKGRLGSGVEYWKGYYQSLRPTQMGLSLNIDISATSFFEPVLVIDFVATYLNIRDFTRPLSDQNRIKVKKALKSVRVDVEHLNFKRSYKVNGLSNCPISQLTFKLDDQRTDMFVVQYFREKYNLTLRHVMLPALQVGSESRPIYMPMEVCRISKGQRYTKKLNTNQVTELLTKTCQRPVERERAINKIVKQNKYMENKLVNDEFGIQVRKELAVVDARVLTPPMLQYHETGQEKRVRPQLGCWNMINKKMINGGKVESWACVNFSLRLDKYLPEEFCKQLIGMCNSKGMEFAPSPLVFLPSCNPSKIEETLKNVHNRSTALLGKSNKQLQLLIIILPDVTGSYGKIKRICETELGIVSQCCQPKNVYKLSKQYMENVALKINVKVGGRNTVLYDAVAKEIPYITDCPTIIFGADVTHPHAGEDSSPSIAAVVASMDWPEVTKYRGIVSAQAHRQEIIEDLYKTSQDRQRGLVHAGIFREHFIAFRRSTGQKPHRIIFYRDGVSEGQFSQVLLHEMDAIRRACSSLEEGYLPPVTFVVVQKRHHTRLFPFDHGRRDLTDKSGNIQPGTVVDTGICHPTEFDFYLNSHAGIKGTSRPAHYHVLYDENKFTADALQVLTNNLCYTYARCTRSVSIVPPVYYAHLAAFRARYYIEGETSDIESTTGGGRAENVAVRPLPVIPENVKNVMFYC